MLLLSLSARASQRIWFYIILFQKCVDAVNVERCESPRAEPPYSQFAGQAKIKNQTNLHLASFHFKKFLENKS